MKESLLQNKVMKYLKSKGIYARKLHDTYTSGLPDIVSVIRGRAVFFELKSTKGKLSRIQAWEANQIWGAGGSYFEVRNMEQVKEAVNRSL